MYVTHNLQVGTYLGARVAIIFWRKLNMRGTSVSMFLESLSDKTVRLFGCNILVLGRRRQECVQPASRSQA